jgi:lysophospholipase L1-like esterase
MRSKKYVFSFGVIFISLLFANIQAQVSVVGKNSSGNPIKILPFGESTTEAGNLYSYRKSLSDSLMAHNVSFDFIGSLKGPSNAIGWDTDHQGMSGKACRDLSAWIKANSTTYKADIILLWEGTNDCGWGWQWYGTPISALSTLIDDICANQPQAELFVSTIPAMAASAYVGDVITSGLANSNATAYNSAMQELINLKVSQGKKVHFVDTRGVILLTDLTDGIHPNQAGYNKMTPYWLNAIKPYLGLNTGIVSSIENKHDSVNLYAKDNQIVVDLLLFPEPFDIFIYDGQGKQMFSKKIQGGKIENINMPLNPGTYIVTIYNSKIQQSKKVVVQ